MMVSRNLIQLFRSACAARSLRLDTIKPINWWIRPYSKKSPSSSCGKGSCEPCEDETGYDCEAPSSKFPPNCCDEIKPMPPSCEPEKPMCPRPTVSQPCKPACDTEKKPACPPKPSNMPLILLLLGLITAAGACAYLYNENKKCEDSLPPPPPPPPTADPEPPPTAVGPLRIERIRPNWLETRNYTKKSSSSPSRDESSKKDAKSSCEPCQDDPELDPECGCETPASRFPTFPLCEDGPISSSKGAVGCPPVGCPQPICPPPSHRPPCEPVCSAGPKKPVVCPPKSAKVDLLRMLSLFVVIPGIMALTAFVFLTRGEIPRPPFVPYSYMRIHNNVRKWPWNSDKSLFYNSRVNALANGYEFEEEGETSLTSSSDEGADGNEGDASQDQKPEEE